MDDLTIVEWFEKKHLSNNEIDFLMAFIPNISVIQVQPDKLEVMCQSFNRQFPKANLNPEANYLDYDVFKDTIQNYIDNKVSVAELLTRMSAQNLCKPLCDFFLALEKQ